jgi:hypothetical protein
MAIAEIIGTIKNSFNVIVDGHDKRIQSQN